MNIFERTLIYRCRCGTHYLSFDYDKEYNIIYMTQYDDRYSFWRRMKQLAHMLWYGRYARIECGEIIADADDIDLFINYFKKVKKATAFKKNKSYIIKQRKK